jgi:hypothetical protein
MTSKNKRRSVGIAVFIVFALAAGGAYAYWTNSGSGTGTATTANPAANQLTVSGTAINGLAPGVAAKTLTGTISNPAGSPSDFHVNSLTASIAVDAAHVTAGCATSDYTLVQPSGVTGDVPIGGTLGFSSGTIAFNNKVTNQDFCKGATVTITYTVS